MKKSTSKKEQLNKLKEDWFHKLHWQNTIRENMRRLRSKLTHVQNTIEEFEYIVSESNSIIDQLLEIIPEDEKTGV